MVGHQAVTLIKITSVQINFKVFHITCVPLGKYRIVLCLIIHQFYNKVNKSHFKHLQGDPLLKLKVPFTFYALKSAFICSSKMMCAG
jgi:hypothetical protein